MDNLFCVTVQVSASIYVLSLKPWAPLFDLSSICDQESFTEDGVLKAIQTNVLKHCIF